MKVNLNPGVKPRESWHSVTLNGSTFDVLVRQPTFDQKIADLGYVAFGASSQRAAHRLESAIVGWRGLQYSDEHDGLAGQEIEFSRDNLHALCEQFPEAADGMFLHAYRAFEGTLKEGEEKN